MFNNLFRGKKVLITGNTGFKGTWISIWLKMLGADLFGFSIDVPTNPSLFKIMKSELKVETKFEDIANYKKFSEFFYEVAPDFIFHLAAQPLVSESYNRSLETIITNCIGTANVLETLKNYKNKCTAVIITSDKSYKNQEWVWGYKETDELGGNDIYSGSKGAAELIINSYFQSFIKHMDNIKVGIGRAGNVIGGGDWAKDRIVVDCFKSWEEQKSVELRNFNATRPWQHVLEPISGYIQLAQKLEEEEVSSGSQFNFGPSSDEEKTVEQVVIGLKKHWTPDFASKFYSEKKDGNFKEASLLKLNCDKASILLGWRQTLNFDETIKYVGEWYNNFYNIKEDNILKTKEQIQDYIKAAQKKDLAWTF